MTTSVNNPADLCNLALVRLGRGERIGNLYDGTPQSRRLLDIYGQTRDAVLCEETWDFAERNVALTLQKTAPANGYFPPTVWDPVVNPPLPWNYQYAYPADCLKIRTIKAAPLQIPNFDPKPVLFDEANDTTVTPFQKVILCNVPNAILVYTGRVTDPATWRPGFVEALVAALARRFAGDINAVNLEGKDEGSELAIASAERG